MAYRFGQCSVRKKDQRNFFRGWHVLLDVQFWEV